MNKPYFSCGNWNCISNEDIYLICVIRDESIMLDFFINYYNNAGVTHFILIDNSSEDDPQSVVEKFPNLNIRLYLQKDSYKEASYGTDWINYFLKTYLGNCYCIIVDSDEILLCGDDEQNSIRNHVEKMKASGKNVQPSLLLDMYPKSINQNYQPGLSFNNHSSFFDEFNTEFYHSHKPIFSNFSHKTGGVRERVFNINVCIHKFPLFKYDFDYKISPGCHFFLDDKGQVVFEKSEKIFESTQPVFLLHYKFIKPDLAMQINRRIKRNQDWDNSAEYKSYSAKIKSDEFTLYSDKYSRVYEGYKSLRLMFLPFFSN